jgi:YggT family protein
MDIAAVVLAINLIARVLWVVIFASVLLSYVLPPYHPVREALDRITEPLLTPIRRLMPQTGMIDLSPMVLIILIEVIRFILVLLVTS